MSDHEGGAIEDWENPLSASGGLSDSDPDYEHPHITNPYQISQNRRRSHGSGRGRHAHANGGRYGQSRGARRGQGTHHPRGIHSHANAFVSTAINYKQSQSLDEVAIMNEASRKFKRGGKPDAYYELSITWDTLLSKLGDKVQAGDIAKSRIDDICRATDTYIPIPCAEATRVSIWGGYKEVVAAKLALDHFEKESRKRNSKSDDYDWSRSQGPLEDARRFNEELRKRSIPNEEQRTTKLMAEQSAGEIVEREYNFEMHLLWPRAVQMEEFISTHDNFTLEALRKHHTCRIEFESAEIQCIKVFALSESALMKTYRRIFHLVKAMMNKGDQGFKTNLAMLPSASSFKTEIEFQRRPRSTLAFPVLKGPFLKFDVEEHHAALEKIKLETQGRARKLIEACLGSLILPETRPCLRFILGEFGLSQYRRPSPGTSAHTFESFRNMIQHSRARMNLSGLQIKDEDVAQLLHGLSKVGALGPRRGLCKVYFDFQSTLSTNTLRLETEIEPGLSTSFKICNTSWYELKAENEDILSVNILDFEGPSLQIHLGATNTHDENKLKDHMSSFPGKIMFNAVSNSADFQTRRKIIAPIGYKELKQVSEVTIFDFSLKNTDGIIRLQRIDKYDETNHQNSKQPDESSWTVQIFYPEWDSRLRQWEHIESNQQLDKEISFEAFFTGDGFSMPTGFEVFMRDVGEIQQLLRAALTKVSMTESAEIEYEDSEPPKLEQLIDLL